MDEHFENNLGLASFDDEDSDNNMQDDELK